MKRAGALLAATVYFGLSQAVPVPGQGTWETTLKARDIQLKAVALDDPSAAFFYDQTLDITWLRNWNVGGAMTWNQAVAWVDNLFVGGLGDWRLPKHSPLRWPGTPDVYVNSGSTDFGTARTGVGWGSTSELGHMYYVTLANKGYCVPNDANPTSCEIQSG